jgi:hypothetical protein
MKSTGPVRSCPLYRPELRTALTEMNRCLPHLFCPLSPALLSGTGACTSDIWPQPPARRQYRGTVTRNRIVTGFVLEFRLTRTLTLDPPLLPASAQRQEVVS